MTSRSLSSCQRLTLGRTSGCPALVRSTACKERFGQDRTSGCPALHCDHVSPVSMSLLLCRSNPRPKRSRGAANSSGTPVNPADLGR
eukprot:1428052-Heterocapsa_arctica.AAC.1